MKNFIKIFMPFVLVLFFGSFAAGEEGGMGMMPAMMNPQEPGMMHHKEMMEKNWQMKKHMMKMMQPRQIIATEDGGIVVLTGNKLVKYDKNLKLIKAILLEEDVPQTYEMKGAGPKPCGCTHAMQMNATEGTTQQQMQK